MYICIYIYMYICIYIYMYICIYIYIYIYIQLDLAIELSTLEMLGLNIGPGPALWWSNDLHWVSTCGWDARSVFFFGSAVGWHWIHSKMEDYDNPPTGWWFGTWILFSIIYGILFPNWLIFFRGIETTNQTKDFMIFQVLRMRRLEHESSVTFCMPLPIICDSSVSHSPQRLNSSPDLFRKFYAPVDNLKIVVQQSLRLFGQWLMLVILISRWYKWPNWVLHN